MTQQSLSLAPFYQGWENHQQHLIKALAPLTAEQLDLRIAAHLRSVGILASHIVAARARWMHYVLHISDESLLEIGKWDRAGEPARTAAELVEGLQITGNMLQAMLQRCTPADLEKPFQDIDDDGNALETYTLQWVIWHLIEHDLHHGGELAFVLGAHNLPALDL